MALYRKTYLCICEGQQEEMYLNHLAYLIKDFPSRVVKLNTIIDRPFRLNKTYEESDSAAIFDYDFNDVEFKRNLELCDKLDSLNKSKKRIKGKRVYHAYSNVNFDLWLILHKEDFNRPVFKNDSYLLDLKRAYGLGSRGNIKSENTIKKILEQINLENIKEAIIRADKIREAKINSDKMIIGSTEYYTNPDFSLHEFIKIVLKDCGQL